MIDYSFQLIGMLASILVALVVLTLSVCLASYTLVLSIKRLSVKLKSLYNHNQLLWIMQNILDKGAKETKRKANQDGWTTMDKEADK